MQHRTGLVYDERYLEHDPGEFLIRYTERYPFDEIEPHPSGPTVVRRTHKLLRDIGYLDVLTDIPGRLAPPVEIERVHTKEMRARVEAVSKTGGDAGYGAPIVAGGEEIARLSAGGALAAVDAVIRGDVRNAFGLIRPPKPGILRVQQHCHGGAARPAVTWSRQDCDHRLGCASRQRYAGYLLGGRKRAVHFAAPGQSVPT